MEQCKYCSNMFGDKKMLRRHQKNTQYCLKIQEIKAKEEIEAKERKEAEELALKEKSIELSCQFCNKQFKTKYLLHIHQTQAKYCLKIQESQNSQNIISSLVNCKFCDKKFSTGSFNRHDSTCKKKNKFLIEENAKLKAENVEKEIYKNLAERSQATIEEIAKKPTYQKTSTKNIQNNLMIAQLTPLNLAEPNVERVIASNYTSNDFYGGQKGAAQMIYKHFVTDDNGKSKIVCTDMKQGAFHHRDSKGEHVIDYNNSHLIKTVHAPLKKKACEIAAEELVKNPDMMKEINKNSSSITELTSKPGVFNTAMAELTGKNSVRSVHVISDLNIDLAITEEWLLENAKFLTIEHILKGAEGYADYALSYPLNNRIIEDEDDYAFVKYTDRNGSIITDHGCKILSEMIFDSIKERNAELIQSNDKLSVDIDDFNFRNEFITILMSNI